MQTLIQVTSRLFLQSSFLHFAEPRLLNQSSQSYRVVLTQASTDGASSRRARRDLLIGHIKTKESITWFWRNFPCDKVEIAQW
jgi:hypothetical protein